MTSPRFLNYSKWLKILTFFLLGLLVGGLVLFLVLTGAVVWVKNKYRGRVYPGVYLFSTSIAGKTTEDLEEFIAEKEKDISQRKIVFLWHNNSDKYWEVIPQMINFSLNNEVMIKEALSKGREEKGTANFLELHRLLLFPENIETKFNFSEEKLKETMTQMSVEVDRPVQNALFEFKKGLPAGGQGKVVNFQVSKEGREVDCSQIRILVLLAFSQPSFKKPVIALDLPVKTILPKVTTEESNRLGIRELLAEGESFFKDSIPSRVHNIILASSYLHGVVVPPGEIFSFAEKIGTISAQTGYQQAYIIKEKKTILEDGGGVCQVSTTLFRAAINAGLPIIERQPHYYRVGFYEQGGYPPGLDATVYPPSPDLKFRNDTLSYILIQTNIDKEGKRLAFEFYGTADGRKTEVDKPIIHSQTPPPEPIYVDEPNLPAGVIKRVDTAHWGAKVSFKRRVSNADGSLKEERQFWSNYVSWPAVYQRGVGQ